ncbi:unnamed protein product, partial [marine sediment metagenome]
NDGNQASGDDIYSNTDLWENIKIFYNEEIN